MNARLFETAGTTRAIPAWEAARAEVNQHSPRYVWYVILLLSVVNAFNYMDRMALAVLSPAIKADLQLSDAQLGLLTGFAFATFYAICGLPIACWADRGNRRNIVAMALATWSVMTSLSGAAQSFWHLFLARVGIGVGEAGCLPPAQSMICDYVPLERRSGVFAIHTFGLFAGMMLGMALAGRLAETIGWRLTFVVLGLPGIALAAIVRFTLREPVRGALEMTKDDGTRLSFLSTIKVLWRCRTYRMLLFFAVFIGFIQYGLTQWWPSFYTRTFGLSLSSVGVYLGLALGIGSGSGLLLGGFVANKVARRDERLPLIIGSAVTSLALPAAVGTLFVPSVAGSMTLVALTGVFLSVSSGPAIAVGYSVVRCQIRAISGALNIFVAALLGFGLGPLCVGLLSDILRPFLGDESLRYALLAPSCLIPAAVIALYAASRTLRGDLQALGVAR